MQVVAVSGQQLWLLVGLADIIIQSLLPASTLLFFSCQQSSGTQIQRARGATTRPARPAPVLVVATSTVLLGRVLLSSYHSKQLSLIIKRPKSTLVPSTQYQAEVCYRNYCGGRLLGKSNHQWCWCSLVRLFVPSVLSRTGDCCFCFFVERTSHITSQIIKQIYLLPYYHQYLSLSGIIIS